MDETIIEIYKMLEAVQVPCKKRACILNNQYFKTTYFIEIQRILEDTERYSNKITEEMYLQWGKGCVGRNL